MKKEPRLEKVVAMYWMTRAAGVEYATVEQRVAIEAAMEFHKACGIKYVVMETEEVELLNPIRFRFFV